MRYTELDTPSLLIDRERLLKNLADLQQYADENGVSLRPHTKTHKMPKLAKLQVEQGACGIAVAKTGEAEVMADQGLSDIFIAFPDFTFALENSLVIAMEEVSSIALSELSSSFAVP